tara:strand:- start:477 stop:776 length:300 start_codon:yes stop_codon:yes gene_type:complete
MWMVNKIFIGPREMVAVPLGQFTSKDGNKYDLGILEEANQSSDDKMLSFAIVYGKEPREYISGHIRDLDHEFGGWFSGDYRTETIKRYREYLKNKQEVK